jgi:phosphohistidine swiveling domain-containing protein
MILGKQTKENTIGAKATKLQELADAGHAVPKFVVLSPDYLENLDDKDLLADIKKHLAPGLYAVRSAAFTEDGDSGSQAGQFMTKLAVHYEDVLYATLEVLNDARDKSNNHAENFSVIIQEFIEPDFAGVLFTRNPLGGSEMTLEYTDGRGELVVSGKKSVSVLLYSDAVVGAKKTLPFLDMLISQAKKIENQFNFPQDIEWAYAGGKLYILQSRPITSLTEDDYQESIYLDKVLPNNSFYYEQTPVTESFDRPTPLALSILSSLYSQGGPLQMAYDSLGIEYSPADPFVLVGNQMYVNKQIEAQSLFPSLGFLKYQTTKTKFESFSGAGATVKNSLNLIRASVRIYPEVQARLLSSLKDVKAQDCTLELSLENLRREYKAVFEINLRAQLALARLESMSSSELMTQKILSYSRTINPFPVSIQEVHTTLVGNSLSIDDTSDFLVTATNSSGETVSEPSELSFKEKALLPKAAEVNQWLVLRELGRWLTVKLVSDVRDDVLSKAESKYGAQKSLVFFATLDEVLEELPEKEILSARKNEYESFDKYSFPRQLASFDTASPADQSATALSPGKACGILCAVEGLKKVSGKKVLFVDALTPDLTQFFGHIEGIVCCRGGLLSHLAIVAREAGLPVVVDSHADRFLGKKIYLDTLAADKIILSKNL